MMIREPVAIEQAYSGGIRPSSGTTADHNPGAAEHLPAFGILSAGVLRYPEFYDARTSRLNLPINRFDLGDYLGIAPETAARAFARLERKGLARRLKSGSIKILDVNGLWQLQRARRPRNSSFIKR
jgi:hypothetical protein